MHTHIRWLLASVVLALGLTAFAPLALSGPARAASASPATTPSGVFDPCPPAVGKVGCGVLVRLDGASAAGSASSAARASTAATPAGFSPADLRSAYGLQSGAEGTRQTVAIVTRNDDPNAEADLGTYRSQYGLPACTTADGCFRKVDENGGTSYPGPDSSWAMSTSEAEDLVSAICPNCHILLVEANAADGFGGLGAAENTAIRLGAKFIANFWETPETGLGSAAEASFDSSYLDHPGVAITAGSGDSGYGTINYPAASQYVTAVGGTTLTKSGSGVRGWTETAWSGTSSGCSAYEPKPSWQKDAACSGRTLNDTAALGDLSTPAAVYDSYCTPNPAGTSCTGPGWMEGAGTAGAAAIVAAAYALAGTPAAGTNPASYLYQHGTLLNSITQGSSGTCTPSLLCTAGPGYNGLTGMGTAASSIPFMSSGTFTGQIHSAITGKCLDNQQGSTADFNVVDLYSCNPGGSSQQWTVEPDGTIQIASGCLDVYLDGTADGTKVEHYHCDGAPAQQWRSMTNGELVNPHSGKCLDDPNATTTDGTQLQIYTCNGSVAQQWTLPYPVPSTTGAIGSGISSGLCLDDRNASTANNNPIQIYGCNGSSAQQWTIEPNGSLEVLGHCMDLTDGNSANGTKIQLYTCLANDNQQWRVLSDGSLLNTETGKCVDDLNGSSTPGTQLQLYTCIGSTGQLWKLP